MIRTAVAALFVAGLAGPVWVSAQTPPPSPPSIVTQGEATLKRAPDRAWLTVATETRESKPADARRRNAEVMTDVQRALRGAGLAADAIRTTGFSLTPEMDWNNGRGTIRGYVARNQIEVRVDDLDKLADVIDAANVPKASGLSIIGPRFDLKNEQAAQNEALRLAVEAAMGRAQAIAAGAKRSVGPVIRIEEQGSGPVFPKPMMATRAFAGAADMAVETPITPGDIEVRAQVTLTVELR
jgi:uncharacterized protein YggE